MQLNENTLKVYPLDTEKVEEFVTRQLNKGPYKLAENQSIKADRDALIEVRDGYFLTDTDCCYGLSVTELFGTTIKEVLRVKVSIVTRVKVEGGHSESYSSLYISVPGQLILKQWAKAPVSLRDFMGSRFGYNPRIIKNTRDIINVAKDCNYIRR